MEASSRREVVAHDHQRALVAAQEPHQPGLGVGVEMVRGLVQQQQVRAPEQDPGELQTTTLPARERAHGKGQAILRQAESGRDRPGFGLAIDSRRSGGTRPPDARIARRCAPRDPPPAGSAPSPIGATSRPGRAPIGCRRDPRRRRRRGAAGGPAGGTPALPAPRSSLMPAGASRARTFSVLVLPAPLRPTTPTLSPGAQAEREPFDDDEATGFDGEVAYVESCSWRRSFGARRVLDGSRRRVRTWRARRGPASSSR